MTYVPEHIKKEIRDQLREEVVGQAKEERWGDVNVVPEWQAASRWKGIYGYGNRPTSTPRAMLPLPIFRQSASKSTTPPRTAFTGSGFACVLA